MKKKYDHKGAIPNTFLGDSAISLHEVPGVPSDKKNLLANATDTREVGSIPGSGRFPERGYGNPLQYSSLENLMDRGVW